MNLDIRDAQNFIEAVGTEPMCRENWQQALLEDWNRIYELELPERLSDARHRAIAQYHYQQEKSARLRTLRIKELSWHR